MPTLIGIALWALIPGFIAKKKGRSFWGYYFLSFLITPLITMIITACLKNISGESDHSSNSVIETTSVPVVPEINRSIPESTSIPAALPSTQSLNENGDTEPSIQMPVIRKIQYCRRCGFKLIDGSEFCSNCGNKIESEDEE
ncbi:MAG TPA: zinc ribbon domain-containing protein [Lachnospiraceae bacterium]|nr:zinc ribbon domain-containing protein [Lachnospiraceae bacterium]